MKKLIIILVILAIGGFFGYKYLYQSHRNIEKEEASFNLEAISLVKEFSKDAELASKKYLNKTIIVKGALTEIESNSLMLANAAYCTFDANHGILETNLNSVYSIKGRCIGYDELLEIVKLDQASIIK
ncbi:hypothetical protein [uncultured Aquimarina sp.]|uniref:OB-fold protein n=1 Tax=uncultured Aquimarina sp. TaxID=575652 RepID=UPI002638F28D|nr:hypothetical protein [uncultured Aquimarina sp.]